MDKVKTLIIRKVFMANHFLGRPNMNSRLKRKELGYYELPETEARHFIINLKWGDIELTEWDYDNGSLYVNGFAIIDD